MSQEKLDEGVPIGQLDYDLMPHEKASFSKLTEPPESTQQRQLGEIALRVLLKAAELDPTRLTQNVYEARITDLVSTYGLSEADAIRLINHTYKEKLKRWNITLRVIPE